MHTVVDDMSACKSNTLLDCRLTMKRETTRQIKIAEPTYDIPNSIGDTNVNNVIKNEINYIMNNCSNDTNNDKASELALFIVLMQKSNYTIYCFLEHLTYKRLSCVLTSPPSFR